MVDKTTATSIYPLTLMLKQTFFGSVFIVAEHVGGDCNGYPLEFNSMWIYIHYGTTLFLRDQHFFETDNLRILNYACHHFT